jgi:hypothetical protein
MWWRRRESNLRPQIYRSGAHLSDYLSSVSSGIKYRLFIHFQVLNITWPSSGGPGSDSPKNFTPGAQKSLLTNISAFYNGMLIGSIH